MKVIDVSKSPVIVALDFDDDKALLHLVDQLDPSLCRVKIGKEVFTHFGPTLVSAVVDRGFDVFLDLKFHDIPNTVAKAVRAAADLGVWMVNVHALGGLPMMEAAVNALADLDKKPHLIAVTVLTSMSNETLQQLGLPDAEPLVSRLTQMAADAGMDGVVCSAKEASSVKALAGNDFLTVTPGIRPVDSAKDDQHRVMTPKQAVGNKADYLVIGRPITQHVNPLAQLSTILQSLK